MKKSVIIGLMLCALSIVTWSCNNHDEEDTNVPEITSLNGRTWRYDLGQSLTALITFSTNSYVASVTRFYNNQSYEMRGSYSYDGDTLTCSYEGTSFKLYCVRKSDGESLANTKWMSEKKNYNGTTQYGTLEFFTEGRFYENHFLGGFGYYDHDHTRYSYDGNTITFTDFYEGTASLECGSILYEMARVIPSNNDNPIW